MIRLIFCTAFAALISGAAIAQDSWDQDYLSTPNNWGTYGDNANPYALEGYTGEGVMGYGNDNSLVPQPAPPSYTNPYLEQKIHPQVTPTCYSTWQGPYWVTRCQ